MIASKSSMSPEGGVPPGTTSRVSGLMATAYVLPRSMNVVTRATATTQSSDLDFTSIATSGLIAQKPSSLGDPCCASTLGRALSEELQWGRDVSVADASEPIGQ